MKNEDLEKITKSIEKKIGKEQSALIHDDLATIILSNNEMNTELKNYQEKIDNLQKEKEDLIITNNRLFQQVGIGEEQSTSFNEKEKKEPFSFKSVFDENGNFKNKVLACVINCFAKSSVVGA